MLLSCLGPLCNFSCSQKSSLLPSSLARCASGTPAFWLFLDKFNFVSSLCTFYFPYLASLATPCLGTDSIVFKSMLKCHSLVLAVTDKQRKGSEDLFGFRVTEVSIRGWLVLAPLLQSWGVAEHVWEAHSRKHSLSLSLMEQGRALLTPETDSSRFHPSSVQYLPNSASSWGPNL